VRRSLTGAALALALAGGLAAGVGGPGVSSPSGLGPPIASAHSVLTGVEPADGSTVRTAPGSVALTFNEEINPGFATVTVMDGERRNHAQGTPQVAGSKVTATVDTLPAGDYTVGYRVTSADGHVVQGSARFTVAGATAGATGSETSAPAAEQSADEQDGGTDTGTVLLVLAGVAVLLMGGALLLLRRSRRS